MEWYGRKEELTLVSTNQLCCTVSGGGREGKEVEMGEEGREKVEGMETGSMGL